MGLQGFSTPPLFSLSFILNLKITSGYFFGKHLSFEIVSKRRVSEEVANDSCFDIAKHKFSFRTQHFLESDCETVMIRIFVFGSFKKKRITLYFNEHISIDM